MFDYSVMEGKALDKFIEHILYTRFIKGYFGGLPPQTLCKPGSEQVS